MYTVYILKSLQMHRFYIGHAKDVMVRLSRHNKGLIRSTRFARPWGIVYTEVYSTKSAARKRELQIKSFKSGEGLRKLLQSSRAGTEAVKRT